MNIIAEWFGTDTEKKRERYRALYNDLKSCYTDYKSDLKILEGKIEGYENSRPEMSNSYIPEDEFSGREKRIKTRVGIVKGCLAADADSLSEAVDAAYARYKYYEKLAEEEHREREAAARREDEKRRASRRKR